jgi:hypothetical protein
MLPLAAFFVAAVARAAAISARVAVYPAQKALGAYFAPIAEAAGFERLSDTKEVIAVLLSRSGNFEGRSFPRFLVLTLDLVSKSNRSLGDPDLVSCNDIWRKRIGDARAAYGVWNQRPELVLES